MFTAQHMRWGARPPWRLWLFSPSLLGASAYPVWCGLLERLCHTMWTPWIPWGFGVALNVCIQAAEGNFQSLWTPSRSDWWCWSIPGLSVLPLPAWGWASRKETGSRHSPSGITDSMGPVQTLQLFPSFSFFLVLRCVIAIGGTTYCYTVIWESLWTCFSWALVTHMWNRSN